MARTLFERVFRGSDEMFAKAEAEVNKLVAELGPDAPMTMPSTASPPVFRGSTRAGSTEP